jgi:conjugal transfer pilus assembly protein TraV
MRSSLVLLPLVLAGCQALVPYDNEFACAKSHDYGKCMDVQSAYDEARARQSIPSGPAEPGTPFQPIAPRTPGKAAPARPAELRGELVREAYAPEDAAARLRDARYRELAGLIENPVTPLVRAPKVLRTLIVSYNAGDTLYMPRYVYYFGEDAQFVLGDYLEAAPPERTMFPNGGPMARSTP